MARRWKVLLYVLFTLAAVFVAALLTFPWEALGRRLEAEAAKAAPGSVLVINEIGPALPLGVRLANVVYQSPDVNGVPGWKVHVERVRVYPKLLKLLTGTPAASFDVKALGGSAQGWVAAGRNERALQVSVSGMDLGDQVVEKLTGLQLAGRLEAALDLVMDPKGTITGGTVKANVDGAKLKTGKVKGFPVPALELGAPEADIVIDKGEGKIGKLRTRSPDLTVDVTGTLSMRPSLAATLLRGQLKAQPSEAWLGRNPAIKSVLSFAGSCRKPDNSLEVGLDGPLGNPLPPTACR